MKIWELGSDDNSRELTFDNQNPMPDEHPIYSRIDGSLLADKWDPCYVMDYRKGKYTDFPYFCSGLLVFSKPTYDKIGSYIQDQVEYLPLIHAEMEFIAVNVTNLIDCVDKERSVAKRLSSGGLLGYKKVVFIAEKIPADTMIFRLPESVLRIFVTDRFIELVKKHRLKGFQFTEVWDSEFTDEMEQEKQRKYKETLDAIEQNKGPECSYEDAVKKVQNGQAMASGKWKMQLDPQGRFWLGQLGEDAEYHWLMPAFMPPVLLGYMWHPVESSSIQPYGG